MVLGSELSEYNKEEEMRKVTLMVLAVFVAVMFASVAVAATSTSCSSCAKPCNTCAKPASCNKCAKPSCNTCANPGNIFKTMANKVSNIVSPCGKCGKATCNTCAKPCVTEQKFKRDVLGQKVPVETVMAGDAMTDTATKYEAGLITGKE